MGRGQVSESSATPNNTFRVVVFRRTGYQKCAKSLGIRFSLAFFARTVGPCWLAWTASLHLPLGRVAPAGWARRCPCICCLVGHLVFWLWLSWVVPLHLLLGRLALRNTKPHNHKTHRPKHSHPKPQTAPTSKITQTTKRPATPKRTTTLKNHQTPPKTKPPNPKNTATPRPLNDPNSKTSQTT